MDITLRGLIPDRDYHIQARATAGAETSEWSQTFVFHTGNDEVAPLAPSNFAVKTEGRDFLLSWTKPTANEDGTTPVRDLRGYELTVRPAGVTTPEYKIFVPGEKWQFEYWENFLNFGGYKGNLTMELRSVDLSGNMSTTPATFNAVKAATPAPTGLTWGSTGDSFVATWTAPAGDVQDYQVVVTAGAVSKTYYTASTRWELSYTDNQVAFAGYQPTVSIAVKTRNSAQQLSDVAATATATNALPNPPTALSWAAVGDSFEASWTAPATNTDGSAFSDLRDYEITIIAGTNSRKYVTPAAKFSFTYLMNKSDFLTPQGTLTIEVRARDSTGRTGAAASALATNAAPAAPTAVTGEVVSDGIRVTWTQPADDDVTSYQVWVAGTATDVGTLSTVISAPASSYLHATVAYTSDHYIYLKSVDQFGTPSPESVRTGPHRPKNPFSVDAAPPGASTLTTATPARAVTEQAAVTLTWTTPADSDLAGFQIRYSENTSATRVWQYRDVPDKSATTTTIEGLRSSTPYVFQLRPYDYSLNTQAGWPAEVAGTSSKSNIAPAEISTSVSIISGGTLRSADYVSGGTTGWLLQSSGLDILGGSVNARVIRAGELRSTVNTTIDGTTQPMWSLNLGGNASLNDVRVRGKIVVGMDPAAEVGINNAGVAVASWNFGATGQTGAQWAIRGDGTFDIKSGTGTRVQLSTAGLEGWNGGTRTFFLNASNGAAYFDGDVRAAAGNFYGTVSVAGRLEVYGGDSYVIARRSGSGAWVMLDGRSGTDDAISSSSGNFRVTYDGLLVCANANISGTVTAGSGTIGGWTINATSLTASGVTIGNNGVFTGASFSGGAVYANTVRSANAPGTARSWCLQNDIAYRVWNINGAQTVTIDIDGNATFNNLTAHNGTFSGTVNASGGNFTGIINGGDFRGGYFRTSGGAGRVEIGPNLSFYGGSGNAIVLGGGASINSDINNNLQFKNYDASALSFMTLAGPGWWQYQSADGNTGGNLVSVVYMDGRGLFIDRGLTLNNHVMYIRGHGDSNHYIQYGGANGDGPVISGYSYFGVRSGRFNAIVMRLDADGNLFVRGSGNFNQSTQRGKKNIATLPANKGLEAVKKFRAVQYERTDGGEEGKVLTGVIAEEVAAIAPELVLNDADGIPEAVNYAGLTPYLIKAVQELSAEVERLKARLPAQP